MPITLGFEPELLDCELLHDANTIFVAVGPNPNFGRYAFSPAALVFPDVSNIPFCSINHDCYCDIPCM